MKIIIFARKHKLYLNLFFLIALISVVGIISLFSSNTCPTKDSTCKTTANNNFTVVALAQSTGSCVCQTDNTCSNQCTFVKDANTTYNSTISCMRESVFGTSTSTDMNSYCNRPKRTIGDANGDGVADNTDYFYYVRAVNGGLIPNSVFPDFDGNGFVTPSDRAIIIKSLNGQIVPLTITPPTATTTSAITPTTTMIMPKDPTWSSAMDLWKPNPLYDLCYNSDGSVNATATANIENFHNNFSVIAPDGKRYPTWHPPVAKEPTTGSMCHFGHEHGSDPTQSALWPMVQQMYAYDANHDGTIEPSELAAAGIPFGYANEQLDVYNTANNITNGMRHEDHVGHKIMYANNVQRDESVTVGGSNRQPIDLYCDMFEEIHQGTHSKDAFTNNIHEVKYFINCDKGSLAAQYPVKMGVNIMVAFGKPGGFSEGGFADGFHFIPVGPAVPANSPAGNEPGRSLPTIDRVKTSVWVPSGQFSDFSQGLYEDWISGNYIVGKDGSQIAYFDPHFAVFSPSRYYDPSQTDSLARSINVCYEGLDANGNVINDPTQSASIVRKAHGGACDEVTNYQDGTTIPVSQRISYDDPRSPFNGCMREFYFDNNNISNSGGPTIWYTDPYGKNASRTPFPGSIPQYIAPVTPTLGYNLESIAMGKDINWCPAGSTVHAPN